MPISAFVAYAAIGAVAGWVGGMLLKRRGLGSIGNILTGVIGALIVGVVVSAAGLCVAGSMGSLLAAALGAAVLLVVLGLARGT